MAAGHIADPLDRLWTERRRRVVVRHGSWYILV
jgi:hypothetical protein